MPLERKNGLRQLLVGRAKESTSKDTSGSQLPPAPPPSINPFTPANMKKRKKDKEVVGEWELVPYNEEVPLKLPKTAKGKRRASLVKSNEDRHVAEVCPSNSTCNLQLELNKAVIPWNSTIREFQKGNAHYLANALEQPLLLPKDMAALKNVRQQDLFLSLKMNLALVSFSTHLNDFMLGCLFLFDKAFLYCFCAGYPRGVYSRGVGERCQK